MKKQVFTATCCHNFIRSFLQFYHIEKQSSSDEMHVLENIYKDAIFLDEVLTLKLKRYTNNLIHILVVILRMSSLRLQSFEVKYLRKFQNVIRVLVVQLEIQSGPDVCIQGPMK